MKANSDNSSHGRKDNSGFRSGQKGDTQAPNRKGPLANVRVIELAALGPAQFAAGLLGDLGAEVVRIDRIESAGLGVAMPPVYDFYNRSKQSLAVDLKSAEGKALVLDMIGNADILIEGFRPGVAERIGLGPDACTARNPGLIYARMTGWGQEGPLAHTAGHDINYLALTGALHCIGNAGEPPVPPLNLVADLGGGAMYLVTGVLAALHARNQSGEGEVIDVAMVDGVSNLMSQFYSFRQQGMWSLEKENNVVDGGAPFYGTYQTLDGKYLAVGAIEKKFYDQLIEGMGLDALALPNQNDRDSWPGMRDQFASIFKTKSREEWLEIFSGKEACVSPVLDMDEAMTDPHMQQREVFTQLNGVVHPSPAPRFQNNPANLDREPPAPGAQSTQLLEQWGVDEKEVTGLIKKGVVYQANPA
jgi:alpha-methylacyl-CoA racemase